MLLSYIISKLFKVAIGLIFLLSFFIKVSFAEQYIELGDGVKLSYKIGNIDLDSYNGFASKISIFENDKLVGTANSLKISSQKNDDGNITIDQFLLKDISLFDESLDFELVIENIEVKDFDSKIFNDNFYDTEVPYYDFSKHKNFSFKTEGITFKSSEFDLGIKSIDIPKIKYGLLSSGHEFAKDTSFEIKGISLTPNPSNTEMLPLGVILASIGQNSLNMDINSYAGVEDKGLMLKIDTGFDLHIKGGASLKVLLNYSVPIETFNYFYNNQTILNELQNQNFESLSDLNNNILTELGKLQLNHLKLEIEDLGMRKPLIIMYSSTMGVSENEGRSIILQSIDSLLRQFIPLNADKFLDNIGNFIENGGKLSFNVLPPNPLPLISAAGLLIMPDLAIESLGVSVVSK